MSLKESKDIHVVGIGGIGVSGLAGILQARGKTISGSDCESSETTERLSQMGMRIALGHAPANLPKETDLVVHSLAVPSKNSELKEAKRRGIPMLSYPEALGELTREFFTIAICGTHGKSTITSLIAKVLIEHQFDPTVIVGTKLRELGGMNFRVGKGKLLVLEACEYRRAFLHYFPRIIVLHTLDFDHPDYYKNFEDYLSAFREFAAKLPSDGYFFGNLDDLDVHNIAAHLQLKKFPAHNLFTYSTKYPSSDFFLSENKIVQQDSRSAELKLKIPGLHNRTNALAAYAVASTLGVKPADIVASLDRYKGAARRFEEVGKIGELTVIDDYAHHPAEIAATLQAAREQYPTEKICVVFQPHQYSRTKKLFKEFGPSFAKADEVIIPNIYEARDTEADKTNLTAESFVAELKRHHKHVKFGDGLDNTAEYLKKNAQKFQLVITMGAGDVWKIGKALML